MKKSILWIIGLLFSVSITVVSCDETVGSVDPYFEWEERNQAYIDSIAVVAKANPSEWKIIHSYKSVPSLNELNPDVNDYIYCKILKVGTGQLKPVSTDQILIHYRGQLIPLYNGAKVVFEQSFRGDLDLDVAVPVSFAVNGVVAGWTTALQEMREGDRWEVYIPYKLGYGTSGYNQIPAYSTLIFDMSLVEITTNR